jgi:hypothetical protein
MITPSGQVILLDAIYGEPLEHLHLTRKRLWSEFRLAFPPTAGLARFDKTADLGHASMVAATLTVGRVLQDADYPEGIAILRQEILEIASIRGSRSFAQGVDRFFGSTLPLGGRRNAVSADEAVIDFRKLIRKELGINTCRTAFLDFLLQVETADAEAAAAEVAERERRRAEDAQRLEREQAEHARLEAARIEREQAERALAERKARERVEAERRERERAEAERQERERLEAERKERERLEAEQRERERIETERRERARLEAERVERERAEAERRERERLEAKKREHDRLEAERRERERLETERLDAERRARERLEAERNERERLDAERRERERAEAERKERERLEAERADRERLEAERHRRERLEAERLEAERLERERAEAERRERERLEAERRERERVEAERVERERAEAERRERERLEAERAERERLEREKWEREAEEARLEAERAAAAARTTAEPEPGPEPQGTGTRRTWLVPPDRAAAFEPPVPHEPAPPAAHPYPIYTPPAEAGAWSADLPPADPQRAPLIAPIASGRPDVPATRVALPLAPSPPAPIRLKSFGGSSPLSIRPDVRREPVGDDLSAAEAYEPFAQEGSGRSIPWKLIAAGVAIVGVSFAVWRGYAPSAKPVVESVRKAIPSPVPAPAAPPVAANVGRLTITSQPAGARVLVDGKAAGETPLTIDALKPGRHVVALSSSEGSAKRTVRIEAGQTLTLDVPLYSGFVAISVPFVVNVSEAGKTLGTSENQILLIAGRHELRLANDDLGYITTQTVEVQPGEVARLTLDPRGSANINAVPWAEVYIDGEKAGETPLANVPIRLGVREIVFRNPKFPDRKQTVTVTTSSIATISVDFLK